MHLTIKILAVFFLIFSFELVAQDSSGTQNISLKYSLASHQLTSNDYYASGYNSYNAYDKDIQPMASQSVFVNSERLMLDGTIWRKYSDVDYFRLSSMLGAIAITNTVAYMYQRKVWYTRETTVFHSLDFMNDWNKNQQMDKFGHFTDAYFTSDLTSKIYRWSGISGDNSVWYGALTGWLWMLEIEISDAFMADWGFSWGDMAANTAGSAFFILQQFNYDLLGGIQPKFSWHKSEAWKQMRYHQDPQALIEDYEGMTFWLTVNPYHYFPKSWKEGYSEWLAPLGLAIGVGAKDISRVLWGGYKEYSIGLDIDLRKLPVWGNSNLMKFIASEVNFLRFPLPTIRFTPQGTWVGFYF